MNVSRAFLNDFAYIANCYHWTAPDIAEMKDAIRSDQSSGKRYIEVLAAAHRAGYRPSAGTLGQWCLRRGLGDPYREGFDVSCISRAIA